MNTVKNTPVWNGYDTEINANILFAINTAYKNLGIKRTELQNILNIQFFIPESEDLLWATLHVLQEGTYLKEYIKEENITIQRNFNALEIKLIERFIENYSKKNVNPMQFFIEEYVENVILKDYIFFKDLKSPLGKHFKGEKQ